MNPATTLVFSFIVTVGAYFLSLEAKKRWNNPLTTPVLFSTALIIPALQLAHVSFAAYGPAKEIMTFLLGPATIALAIPLYKNRERLRANLLPASIGIVAGSLSTMVIAGLTAKVFSLPSVMVTSLSIKSATAAIAIEIAKIIHGDPALTATFVVTTGIIGAVLGPWLMNALGIRDPIARGLALGTISHGQGTAQAATEGELTGAIAGIAMGMGAVVTSMAAPIIVPFLAR